MAFWTHPLILSVFVAGVVGQSLKAIINTQKYGRFNIYYFVSGAGMPSVHTAIVTSLTLSVYLAQGTSMLFMVCLVLSFIIMRDVVENKEFASATEKAVNSIVEHLKHHEIEFGKWTRKVGHTVMEVIAGLALGAFSALFVHGLI